MTPEAFINQWNHSDSPLSPILSEKLERFNLSKPSFDFLSIAGLPKYTDAFLSFVNNSDFEINTLIEEYLDLNLLEVDEKFEGYVIIGSCRDGDVIAINRNKNDEIEQLDHEDLFEPKFFNTSINTLAEFIIIYRDFEKDVLADKDPKIPMEFYKFTDSQFDKLKSQMLLVDSRAVIEDGFWKDELEIIFSSREGYLKENIAGIDKNTVSNSQNSVLKIALDRIKRFGLIFQK